MTWAEAGQFTVVLIVLLLLAAMVWGQYQEMKDRDRERRSRMFRGRPISEWLTKATPEMKDDSVYDDIQEPDGRH